MWEKESNITVQFKLILILLSFSILTTLKKCVYFAKTASVNYRKMDVEMINFKCFGKKKTKNGIIIEKLIAIEKTVYYPNSLVNT